MYIIKDFLGAQIQMPHRGSLEYKLHCLTDEEFADGEKLLLRKRLVPVVDLPWIVAQTRYLEQLGGVLYITHAVAAVLLELDHVTRWLALKPLALVIECIIIVQVGTQQRLPLFRLTVSTLYDALHEVCVLFDDILSHLLLGSVSDLWIYSWHAGVLLVIIDEQRVG